MTLVTLTIWYNRLFIHSAAAGILTESPTRNLVTMSQYTGAQFIALPSQTTELMNRKREPRPIHPI